MTARLRQHSRGCTVEVPLQQHHREALMLLLRIVSGPLAGASRSIGRSSFVVGRGAACDWILPDPEKAVSSQHFSISFISDHFVLTDTSTNGVFYNHSADRIPRGESVVLRHGDAIRLANYEIQVSINSDEEGAQRQTPDADGRAPLFGPRDDPFGVNAFNERQGETSDRREPDYFGAPSGYDHFSLPHPENQPFFRATQESAAQENRPTPGGDARLASPAGTTEPEIGVSPAEIFGFRKEWFLGPNVVATQGPEEQASSSVAPKIPVASAAVAPAGDRTEIDPEAVFFPPPQSTPGAVSAATAPENSTTRAHKATESARVAAGDASDALAAFLEAARVPLDQIKDDDPVNILRRAGETYRLMAEGLRRVLAIRAEFKSEYRIERTQLGFLPTNNNPLKVVVEPSAAIAFLLSPRQVGWLGGAEAVDETVRQIEEHELAATVAMREALTALLRCFDPQTLKDRIARQSFLVKLAAGGARAAYWEYFENHYKEIADEAESDFERLLGRQFARAYEEQVRAMNSRHQGAQQDKKGN